MKDDRLGRAAIREERLRATAGLRDASLALTSWRGRSGRRYVVGVHAFDETEILGLTDAVILAVRRDPDGTAHVIDIAAAGARSGAQGRRRWMHAVQDRGATEVHVHRLAESEDERRAVIEDLKDDETAGSERA